MILFSLTTKKCYFLAFILLHIDRFPCRKGSVNEVGTILQDLGVKKSLLVTDEGLHKLAYPKKLQK